MPLSSRNHPALIAYLDFSSLSASTIGPKDRASTLLASLPIDFGFHSVSVNVPADLFPSPVEGYAVLVHNFNQDTWGMFPNAEGHAVIIPEPTSLTLQALLASSVCPLRRYHPTITGRL
jgi:hypothetical protein